MTNPTQRLPIDSTIGMYIAEYRFERRLAALMPLVSSLNSSKFFSSRISVFVVRAPVMPSLYAPVILELILRTSRWFFNICVWKKYDAIIKNGNTAIVMSMSLKFSMAMLTKLMIIIAGPQIRSSILHAITSPSRWASDVIRAIIQPTGVLS